MEADETKRIAKEYLAPLIKAKIDTLILGCTHYPHLSRVIQEIMGPAVTLVDPAEETVKEVSQFLLRSNLASTGQQAPKYQFLVTGNPVSFTSLGTKLLGKPIIDVKQVTLAK